SGVSKVIKEEAAYTSSVKQLTYSSLATTSVTLTWADAAGADDYIIYRVSDGKRYKVTASVKKTRNGKSAKISGLKEGTDYTFAVVPVKEINGKDEEGTEKSISITTSKKQTSQNKPASSSSSSSANYIPRDMPDHESIGVTNTDDYFNYLRAAGFKIEKNVGYDSYYSSYKYAILDNGVVAGYFSSIYNYVDV
ncbi:MAG: fibronectin type III domain-containing protein, partial [Huintestinicola sp.]